MTNRERAIAVLTYLPYDRIPLVHFGLFRETLTKCQQKGYLNEEEVKNWQDGNRYDLAIGQKLGFDFNWCNCCATKAFLFPEFETEVLEALPGGTRQGSRLFRGL